MGAILDNALNNYLTSYNPTDLTKYDTHKKSELRNVYNSIVKMNKESPWYLPTTDKGTQNYAVDLKESAHLLNGKISQLGILEDSGLFQQKSAYSSDEGVVTASYIGSESTEETATGFSMQVHSLASGQENLGKFLPNEPVRLRPATYSFDVSINDMNYEFQFAISDDETNKEIQERLSRLINNSGIGIKVSLEEAEGKTALRMTSESKGLSRGKDEIFHINDDNTSKRSGTVDYFGLDYTTQKAGNATFSINGEEYSASSNRFTVGQSFEVQLRGPSPEGEETTVGLKTDIESLTDNISGLLNSYNDFLENTSSYTDSQSRSKQLVNEFRSIANRFRSSLETVGVEIEDGGRLSINKKVLEQTALQSDNLSETFRCLKDFSQEVIKKSNQVSLNPMDYVEKTVVAYKNPGHNYASPYTLSAYSGMMFNGYC